jgi:hypothetical protein
MPQPSRDDELDRIFNQTVVEDLGIPEWWVKQSKAALHSHIEEAVREAGIKGKYIALSQLKEFAEKNNYDKLMVAGYLASSVKVLEDRIAALTQEGKTE